MAAAAALVQHRERERELARGYALGPPPLAHPSEYGTLVTQVTQVTHAPAAGHHARMDYVSPPAAHGQGHPYAHPSPGAVAHHHQGDFYAAAAAAALAGPAAVYVTAAGYQPVALPPPQLPSHHPARHPGAVLAAPPPAHVQPAATLFPAHPTLAAAYGYAPLSPGKTRYLY